MSRRVGVLTSQSFNKLAAIYRLCAALEVEPADVLPRITGICEKSSPDAAVSQGEMLSDKSGEEPVESIVDVKEGQ